MKLKFKRLFNGTRLLTFESRLLYPLTNLRLTTLRLGRATRRRRNVFRTKGNTTRLIRVLITMNNKIGLKRRRRTPNTGRKSNTHHRSRLLSLKHNAIRRNNLLVHIDTRSPSNNERYLPSGVPLTKVRVMSQATTIYRLARFNFHYRNKTPFRGEVPCGYARQNKGYRYEERGGGAASIFCHFHGHSVLGRGNLHQGKGKEVQVGQTCFGYVLLSNARRVRPTTRGGTKTNNLPQPYHTRTHSRTRRGNKYPT